MPRVESHHGAYIIYGRGHGRKGTLVQTDWEYPATAGSLGWSLSQVQRDPKTGETLHFKRRPSRGRYCDHGGTDGTVKCPACGVTASEFIGAAAQYLDDRAT